MNVLGIEAFLAITVTNSISRAAELLHLSQSTISHRLILLEQQLGAPLLLRSKGSKSISLTSRGQDFIAIAERWMYLLEDTRRYQEDGNTQYLSIAAVDSLNTYVFPPLYRLLSRHAPLINLRIRTHQSTEIYNILEKREIDVGFVLREINTKNIVIEPLFCEEMVLIRRLGTDRTENAPIHPTELDPQYEFFFDWGSNYRVWHDSWWGSVKYPRFWSDTAHLIRALMDDPLNWAIVPISMANFFLETGNYGIYDILEPPPNRICYKITHRNTPTNSKKCLRILDEYLQAIKPQSS